MTELMEKTTFKTTKDIITHAAVPISTRTYRPISNSSLIDLTLEELDKAGLIVHSEMYSATTDAGIVNAKFVIGNVSDPEMRLQIGWQNSYNKKVSFKAGVGVSVIICQNGLVTGNLGTMKKSHKGLILSESTDFIKGSIESARETFEQIQIDRDAMKEIEISKRVQSEILGRLFFEEEIIRSTQINIIKDELKNPTFDYGAPDSMWSLYQHVTFSLREIHPALYFDTHQRAHNLFVDLIK